MLCKSGFNRSAINPVYVFDLWLFEASNPRVINPVNLWLLEASIGASSALLIYGYLKPQSERHPEASSRRRIRCYSQSYRKNIVIKEY